MMDYGICKVSVSPLRKNYSDTSEMVSQLLFGEKFKIIDTHKQWLQIKCLHDGYEGWLDSKHVFKTKLSNIESLVQVGYSSDLYQFALCNSFKIPIVCGSPIYAKDNFFYRLLGFTCKGLEVKKRIGIDDLVGFSSKFIHVPYLWGGRSTFGIDCSGLMQLLLRFLGKDYPRDASMQVLEGRTVQTFEDVETHDIAFFQNDKNAVIHVGIMLNKYEILHAHGHVRIDTLDSEGILNRDTKQYSHKLHSIQRVL